MRYLLLPIILIATLNTARAQYGDEGYFLRNNGLNIGWNVFQPTWAPMDGLVSHFNNETSFTHTKMMPEATGDGLVLGFSLFLSRKWTTDLEYRNQRVNTNQVNVVSGPADPGKNYQLRMFQHSFRYTLSYGRAFGKWGTTGIYLGAGLFAGTWDLKYKSSTQNTWARQTADDYHGFNMGISPQLIFRTYMLELKAYYDVPFMPVNFGPAYDDVFKQYNTHANGDNKMKGRNISLGVAATLCIPVFKSEAQRRDDAAKRAAQSQQDNSKPNRFEQRADHDRQEMEHQRKLDDMRDQQHREEQQNNERQHERERRGY